MQKPGVESPKQSDRWQREESLRLFQEVVENSSDAVGMVEDRLLAGGV